MGEGRVHPTDVLAGAEGPVGGRMLFYLIPSSERGTCGLMQAKQARTGTRASWSAGRHESLALSFCFSDWVSE